MKKRELQALLQFLEIPEDICNCKSKAFRDNEDTSVWSLPCKHFTLFAPKGFSREEWISMFPSMKEWSYMLQKAYGEEYEDKIKLGVPRETLRREDRLEVLIDRESRGEHLWNPKDVIEDDVLSVEATGKKKKLGGNYIGVSHDGERSSKTFKPGKTN